MGEYNAAGTALQETIYLEGEPVGISKNGQLYIVTTDLRGAPRMIHDGSGQKVWQWTPTAFGLRAPNEKPGSAAAFVYNLRMPGQYYDKETGLFYNNARMYDPATGRYPTPDPIGLDGGINPRAYVANDPVNKVDPMGLASATVAPVGGMPNIIPPQYIPGTPQNQEWNKWTIQTGAQMQQWLAGVGRQIGDMCEAKKEELLPCDPPEGTKCVDELETKHPHGPLNEHYHVYQMQRRRSSDNSCFWAKLGGKVGKTVFDVPPSGLPWCTSFPNFTKNGGPR